jgi:hypothetical protein
MHNISKGSIMTAFFVDNTAGFKNSNKFCRLFIADNNKSTMKV